MPDKNYHYEALHTQEENGGGGGGARSKDGVSTRTCSDEPTSMKTLWRGAPYPHRLLLVISSVMLFASLCLCLFSISVLRRTPSELECAKIVSPYSSIWDQVEYWEGDFVNDFNSTSIYRGPPVLEREKAWDSLWRIHGILIDTDGLAALNKSLEPKTYVQAIGSDPKNPTYAGQVEFAHQLHCLNLIRQYTWPLKMFNESWGDLYPFDLVEPVAARMHVDHCIETVRMSLMCYADITPVLVEITPNRLAGSKNDFNVHHKCRNFEKLRDYIMEQGIEIDTSQLKGHEDM